MVIIGIFHFSIIILLHKNIYILASGTTYLPSSGSNMSATQLNSHQLIHRPVVRVSFRKMDKGVGAKIILRKKQGGKGNVCDSMPSRGVWGHASPLPPENFQILSDRFWRSFCAFQITLLHDEMTRFFFVLIWPVKHGSCKRSPDLLSSILEKLTHFVIAAVLFQALGGHEPF